MKNSKKKESHVYSLRTEPAYNPFFLYCDGHKVGEVENINFFKVENGEGMVVTHCRWFATLPSKKLASISSNSNIYDVCLPYGDIPCRRSLCFGKDLAFYMKEKDNVLRETRLELYLNVSELKDFTIEKAEPQTLYNGTEIRVYDIVGFQAVALEKQYVGDYAWKQMYFATNYKMTKTEFGQLCDSIAEMTGRNMVSKMSTFEVSDLIVSGTLDKVIDVYNVYKSKLS